MQGSSPASASESASAPQGPTVDHGSLKPLSKSAQKKAVRAERYAALKLERRAREKEAKKEKKRLLAEKRAAGELDEDDEEKSRRKKRARLDFGGKVVVDLGFDDKMTDKEITSLCSQLAYTYSANRNASFPFELVFTSLNGRTHQRLETIGDAAYKRWSNTEWWHEGYERLWQSPSSAAEPSTDSSAPEDTTGEPAGKASEALEDVRGKVIYLTADSEDELSKLKAGEIYIIGGLCDHNRYKNLCFNKAKESGIRTARLPIGRYLSSLPTRKVLTVNQVFEILLKWIETKSWEDALYSVIPKRKFQTGGKNKTESFKDGHERAAKDSAEEADDKQESEGMLEGRLDD